MNIIIDEAEHRMLQELTQRRFLVGSRLYGTTHAASDTDYLCVYRTSAEELYSGLPNMHQFQYKDKAGNTDWNYCSELQFRKNLYSGESVIHADIVLFTDYTDRKMELCRTYKVIKAYLGFARRDLKEDNGPKLWHAARSLYCASSLLDNRLPVLDEVRRIYSERQDRAQLVHQEQALRTMANSLYDAGVLKTYAIETASHPLWQKLLASNNNKAFRY
ncbi:hypothetical protein [Taibaiella chishuiensis]|uniref:Nucleotidyltransferase n=1 Tax=Taibaiella chishuiensis TaxID=1434707 RepID=A0A2P8DAS9_9BACT|nr:hypothetical protein [Taibaiella chishuiensis]PSK94332.1 hypothetical protein B0I18_101487 [Taibaiella chishuiensis]